MSKSTLEKRDNALRTLLTPEERTFFQKFGGAVALYEHNVLPSEFDAAVGWDSSQSKPFTKSAQAGLFGRLLNPLNLPKAVVASSIIAGVPLGLVWHAAARRSREQRNDERDIGNQIDYYSDATHDLEHSLARAGL